MLKILNTQQIKAWDKFTIENEPSASIDLMERACIAFVQWFTERFDATASVGIVCGTGNNGGDGMGIARLLCDWGYSVKVWVVQGTVLESEDFKINKNRLPQKIKQYEINGSVNRNEFQSCDLLVDGLFGSGLSRPLEGVYAEVVQEMNISAATRIAVDIPSGLYADKHTTGIVFQADYTITFQSPKVAFLMPENSQFVGEWVKVNIGLSKRYLDEVEASYFWVTRKSAASKINSRNRFSHKGNFGRALLIAGSYGKMGACVLAARAAMRSGLGLLTVHIPQKGYQIIQTTVPEAMASIDHNEEYFSKVPVLDDFDTIAIGPGLGQENGTIIGLGQLLNDCKRPMVIDADALNILAANRELLHILPEGSILTPHPGEFKRLVGNWSDDFERLEKAKALAREIKCVIVLKGAYTTILSPQGNAYFNSTGNPGMAKGGSGDVLTGILTGLLTQFMPPLDAAILGVYLHGAAGDLALYEKGEHALIASDIIEFLPAAFKRLLLSK